MPIPLPQVVADVGPGGPLVTSMSGINALRKQMLENKYYGPNMQSTIENRNALTQGQNIENQYMPEKLRLANAMAGLQNQYYAPNIQSEINSRNALTNKTNTMLPLEAENQRNVNKYYGPKMESDMASAKALANLRSAGGAGMGTGAKEEMFFQSNVARDNPQLKDPNQVYEAANVLRNGGTVLSDGTPLNPMSPTSRSTLDRIIKGTSTSTLVTQGVQAVQAENEIDVLGKYAAKPMQEYGDTWGGYSPQQLMDSVKSDPESQKRLGRFIAAQAMNYEIAQLRNKLAGASPSLGATEHLMDASGQTIKNSYPRLSAVARAEASRYMNEALKAGLTGRQSIGMGASAALGKGESSSKKDKTAPSEADIKFTAKKYGISENEVRRRLGL